jgi:amidohydrolase
MLKQAYAIAEEIVEWRRDFHKHPEIGFDVQRTAGIVADELEKIGYKVQRGVGKTGVLADIGAGGKLVVIRADMDALPILEQNDFDYASQVAGRMHACGHDSHTAMLLGAAHLLAKEKFNGRIRLLFQPSEEATDEEGMSGAMCMVAEGAVAGADYVIAQHVDPFSPAGTIAIEAGPCGGGVDSWTATLKGKGGHGAYPQTTIDPFMLLAHVIMGLNNIVSRKFDPFVPAAVSIGSITGGEADNVIPDQIQLKGTLRFTSLEARQKLHEEITRVFEIAKVLDGNYELKFIFGGMPIINDAHVSQVIEQVGKDLLGADKVRPMHKSLGAEDFPEFLKNAPGAMFTLGTRIEGRAAYELHHPKFDIDERALPIGTAVLVESALRFLKE